MKIAFYKGMESDNFLDKCLCIWTMSKYSHCEIIYADESYSSSYFDGGVRKKSIKYSNKKRWDIYNVQINSLDSKKIVKYYEETKDYKYDLIGLFFIFVLNILSWNKKDKTYCSKWCITAFGRMLKRKSYENLNVTPGQLYKILKRDKIINKKIYE